MYVYVSVEKVKGVNITSTHVQVKTIVMSVWYDADMKATLKQRTNTYMQY